MMHKGPIKPFGDGNAVFPKGEKAKTTYQTYKITSTSSVRSTCGSIKHKAAPQSYFIVLPVLNY